jgi:hypothetical protein
MSQPNQAPTPCEPTTELLVRVDHVAPGFPMIASISSGDKNPSIGRSKRFIGTPSACYLLWSAFLGGKVTSGVQIRKLEWGSEFGQSQLAEKLLLG